MAIILKLLQALAAFVPAILSWWGEQKAAQQKTEVEERIAAMRHDPASLWLRGFNPDAARSGPDAGRGAAASGPDQSDSHK